ncbi:hypothetical protein [Pontiella sp.]|uniref:hypothetical protein n=1 Tax=Pontiella sp. TaxID=2837462 RepID=UPI00356AE29F
MSFRKNKVLFIGGGLGGLILLAELVFVVTGALGLRTQNRLLAERRSDLARLQSRTPFPSEENVEQVRAHLEMLEYQVGELEAALIRAPFPVGHVQAADFSARAQNVIERFRKNAEHAGVGLPAGLEAGFAEYASGGAIPESRHVPRLSRQLYSVECVADVLVNSGVDSIDSLEREPFETVPPPQEPRRRAARGAPPAAKQKRDVSDGAERLAARLYSVERIGVVFTASEAGVWRVLDHFSAAPHFMVVSGFSHGTKTAILDYNPEKVKQGGVGEDDPLAHLSGGILVGEKALSRPERIITGNEPVKVSLTIDVYDFDPAEGER